MQNKVSCKIVSAHVAIRVSAKQKLSAIQAAQIGASLPRELNAEGIGNGGVTRIIHTKTEISIFLTLNASDALSIQENVAKVEEVVERLLSLPVDRRQ